MFTQFSDEEAEEDEEDYYIPHDQRPLSPSRVILFLLAPSLRLGALLLPSVASTSLVVSVPCLVFAAVLAALVRHLWLLLAHYVRRVSVEDVLCEALARVRSTRRWKNFIRALVRSLGVLLRSLLVTIYLNGLLSSLSILTGANVLLYSCDSLDRNTPPTFAKD